MSELADIMEAIQKVSHGGKIRGLSPVESGRVGRLIEKANEGYPEEIREEAPKWLGRMADYWQDRIAGDRVADLELELKAHKIALLGEDTVRRKIGSIQGSGSSLSAQHANGIERMGTGTRPTAAAVAGEGAAGTFDALRPWLRALEILEADEKEGAA